MREFIEYILKQIVSNVDAVKIEEIEESGLFTYQLEVAKEDMGPVIGKEGRTINSIRALVRSKAIKDGIRVRVELIDKDKPTMPTETVENTETEEAETVNAEN